MNSSKPAIHMRMPPKKITLALDFWDGLIQLMQLGSIWDKGTHLLTLRDVGEPCQPMSCMTMGIRDNSKPISPLV
jgi:hypothetical protein